MSESGDSYSYFGVALNWEVDILDHTIIIFVYRFLWLYDTLRCRSCFITMVHNFYILISCHIVWIYLRVGFKTILEELDVNKIIMLVSELQRFVINWIILLIKCRRTAPQLNLLQFESQSHNSNEIARQSRASKK